MAGLIAMAFVFWWTWTDAPRARTTRDIPEPPAARLKAVGAADDTVESDSAPSRSGVVLKGIVVASDRVPVAGASVQILIGGRNPFGTTTADDEGRFRLPPIGRPETGWIEAVIIATDGRGGASFTRRGITADADDEIDVGRLVLAPAHALTVEVHARGTPVTGATVFAARVEERSRLPLAAARADDAGRARFPWLPEGEIRLLAVAAGHGRGEATVRLPGDATARVEMPPERILRLSVAERDSGRPVAGATVECWETWSSGMTSGYAEYLPPLSIAPTDANGETALRGLADATLIVLYVVAPGYPAPAHVFPNFHRVPAGATTLLVELDAPRTVIWPVVDGDVAAPPDGSEIFFRPQVGSGTAELTAHGRIEGRNLVGEGFGPNHFTAIAVAPDGALALVWEGQGETVPVSFRRPRTIEIVARDPEGAPVAGAEFEARNQGNNRFGPPVRTDAEGVARIEGLYGQRADVYFLPRGRSMGGWTVGTVDLDKGGGRIEATLAKEIEILARVRIDGKPALPRSYQLYNAFQAESEDPAKGELRFKLRPPKPGAPIYVGLSAAGYLQASGLVEAGVVEFDLVREGQLALTVVPPADGFCHLQLQRMDPKTREWADAWEGGQGILVSDVREFRKLPRGRYRVRDNVSGQVGEEVEVAPGRSESTRLDLAGVGFVAGRVEVPEGESLSGVRITFDDGPRSPQPVHGDGTFRIRVPGNREIVLKPMHTTLTPAAEGGTARVRAGRKGIVLRLEKGNVARARIDPFPIAMRIGFHKKRVLLYRGDPEGNPLLRCSQKLDAKTGVVTFSGFEPGTYTVWLDLLPGAAPFILRDVELKRGESDLGDLRPESGSSIRVHVRTKEGQDAPRIGVFARHLGAPSYYRGLNSHGEKEMVLRGLGPGRFNVSASPVMGFGGKRIEATVSCDGTNEIVVTLDLR